MKKFAALLLLALMALSPLISLAEKQPTFTAADYVSLSELSRQVADGWHATYTAHGREVVANADVAWMPYYDPRDKDGSLTVPTGYSDYYYSAQTGEMIQTSIVTGSDDHGPLPVGDLVT